MKRREAISCLKKIQHSCFNMSPDAIALVKSSEGDRLSIGYQLHIQANLDQITKHQINTIAEKHQLAINEEPGKIVIYKPKTVLTSA